jgi:hypothetical protein
MKFYSFLLLLAAFGNSLKHAESLGAYLRGAPGNNINNDNNNIQDDATAGAGEADGDSSLSSTANNRMPRCDVAKNSDIHADCPQSMDVLYCGRETTADPRVFGPSVWTFLHTVSLYYDPSSSEEEEDIIERCTDFINGFGPMIPCPHCGEHYNQYLIGTKDTNATEPLDFLWDWDSRGNPCSSTDNLKYFFVKKHDNVGQQVNDAPPTRPKFEVSDLDALYERKFLPDRNEFVDTDQPDAFVPIFLEAMNLIAINYVAPFSDDAKPWVTHDGMGSLDVSVACAKFLTSLPTMLPNGVGDAIPSSTATIEEACQSKPSMLSLVKRIEESLNVPALSEIDRRERYEVRHVCMHNTIWKNHPMCRVVGQPQCDIDGDEDDDCCEPWKPLEDFPDYE